MAAVFLGVLLPLPQAHGSELSGLVAQGLPADVRGLFFWGTHTIMFVL